MGSPSLSGVDRRWVLRLLLRSAGDPRFNSTFDISFMEVSRGTIVGSSASD